MKNVILTLAFMLVGTYAFAGSEVEKSEVEFHDQSTIVLEDVGDGVIEALVIDDANCVSFMSCGHLNNARFLASCCGRS